MKKVSSVSLGGRSFTIDEDALKRLEEYLAHFRAKLSEPQHQQGEVMEEIEGRISELFFNEVGDSGRVVNIALVEKVAATLGMPDGSAEGGNNQAGQASNFPGISFKRLYRDPDAKCLAGICSGLSYYFNVDVTLVRVLLIVGILLGFSGVWVYLILWIAIPEAITPAQKCEMRGIPATAENMRRFSYSYNK